MKEKLLMSIHARMARTEASVMSMRKDIAVILDGLAKAGLVGVPSPNLVKEYSAVQPQLDTAVLSPGEPVANSREQSEVLNPHEIISFKLESMSTETRQNTITVSYDEIKNSVLIELSAGKKPDDTGKLSNPNLQRENSGHNITSSSVDGSHSLPESTGEETPQPRAATQSPTTDRSAA